MEEDWKKREAEMARRTDITLVTALFLSEVHVHIPLRRSLFLGIIFKMNFLSNMFPFDFVLKIKFDRDFILEVMPKKRWAIQGNISHVRVLTGVRCQLVVDGIISLRRRNKKLNLIILLRYSFFFFWHRFLRWKPNQTWFSKRNRTETWLIGISS